MKGFFYIEREEGSFNSSNNNHVLKRFLKDLSKLSVAFNTLISLC